MRMVRLLCTVSRQDKGRLLPKPDGQPLVQTKKIEKRVNEMPELPTEINF